MEGKGFFESDGVDQKSVSSAIDFKRILFRALRYWYVIVISLLIAGAYAAFKNRYATRIYTVSSSIIFRETEEAGGGGELLYNNVLVNQYRNYLNEPYIIKSYPLIESVIEDLHFQISFFKKGRFQDSDVYGTVPFDARLLGNLENRSGSMTFKMLSEDEYVLHAPDKEEATFRFGDTIRFMGLDMVISLTDNSKSRKEIGDEFTILVQNAKALAPQYVRKLGVSWAEQGAGVINLTLTGANVTKEIDFLEGLIRRYQQNDLDKKNQTATKTIEFISNEIAMIADSMKIVEGKLERFRNVSQGSEISSKAEKFYERLEEIEREKAEFLIKENYYKYLLDYLHNGTNVDQVIIPSAMGLTDGVITTLISELVKMQLDIKVGRELNKEGNPILADKQLRINEIKKDLVEAVATLRSTDKVQLNLINKQLKGIESQLHTLPSVEREYISIKRNYSLMENMYIFLMQKLSEAQISKASNSTDIFVVNPPMQSSGAIYPKVGQNYLIALLVGLLGPMIFFGLAEVLNTRVQSKEDIDKLTSLPFIGGIGHKKSESNLVVQQRPRSAISESFRALRSSLNYFTANQDKKVFLVTSSISGEGKTFTAINLASVLAMSGKKTLIIGADMRRPKIFSDFNLDNDKGLSTYLSGISSDIDETIRATEYDNLYLMGGGPVPPNPSELLMTSKMDYLIKTLIERFDFIVIDTPPIALVTDAFLLSSYADHSIFVVRQNFTPRSLLRQMDEHYKSGRLKNISLLLNDIYMTGPGYGYSYGYGYGYNYGYGHKYSAYYSDESAKANGRAANNKKRVK